ncbi:hypothetical protein GCM10009745_38090 [Kribbella yunnanensis]|uniref:Uncharacterized protein n=1 Tax=Kribbella yunnanensis TaxID=190194 RepID=A0ABN2HK61_9ACTN
MSNNRTPSSHARSIVAIACDSGTAANIPPMEASPNPNLLTRNPVRPNSTLRMPPTLEAPTDIPLAPANRSKDTPAHL